MSQCNDRPPKDQKLNNLVVCGQVTAKRQSATEVNTNVLEAFEINAVELDADLDAVLEVGQAEIDPGIFAAGSQVRLRRFGNFVEFTIEGEWNPAAGPAIPGPPAPPTVIARIFDFFPPNRVTGTIVTIPTGIFSEGGISVETDGSVINQTVLGIPGAPPRPAVTTLTWLLTE
jgi:hypothetical protein